MLTLLDVVHSAKFLCYLAKRIRMASLRVVEDLEKKEQQVLVSRSLIPGAVLRQVIGQESLENVLQAACGLFNIE